MSTPPAPSHSPLRTPSSDHPPLQDHNEVEQREAFDHWGYLFQPDKTGTDTLKRLLSGLKTEILHVYDPSTDTSDLTPAHLARFYRDLHGNYDQLFLGTPSESIAFIYKSLGCLHSLQPQAKNHSTAFTDPTVPALKTEGWIMWQTIQLLLGPDEHAGFLAEAVQKWDIKDPATGKAFPKILPRKCFPSEPDRHMVQWYEGVSERLRKEAEDEELEKRAMETDPAEVRRIQDRIGRRDDDDEASTDSRGPALAYFRNPLYRHVDGRPSIVRRGSKRPIASPRPTSIVEKGKEAAGTFGGIVRHIGSPHLWDGRGGNSSNGESRERESDRDRRRRASVPDHRHHSRDPGPPSPATYDADLAPPDSRHRHRRRTPPDGRLDSLHRRPDDDEWDDGMSPGYSSRSPGPGSRPGSHHRHNSDRSHDPSLRHTRSHDPTPSQKEGGDYFGNYAETGKPASRRNSAYSNTTPPIKDAAIDDEVKGHGLTVPGAATHFPGTGFAPSASPLFATHVARHPQPAPYSHPASARAGSADPYSRPTPSSVPRNSRGHNRLGSRDEYDRRDDPPRRRFDSPRRRPEDSSPRQYDSPRRSARFDPSPGPLHDYHRRGSTHRSGNTDFSRSPERGGPRYDPRDDAGDRRGGHVGSRRGSRFEPDAIPHRTPPPIGYDMPPNSRPTNAAVPPDHVAGRKGHRRGGSEASGQPGDFEDTDWERDRKPNRGAQQTRFASAQDGDRDQDDDWDRVRHRDRDRPRDREKRDRSHGRDRENSVTDRGVHGRQYVNATPWK